MFSTLNRYIFSSISLGLTLAISMFLTLDVLIGFIQQVNSVGKGSYTVGSALLYTIILIPNRIFEMFPLSSVVGVMIGLGALAASSELVVIQTSGISRLKIAWITIVTLLIWLVPMTLVGEYVIPPAKLKAESFKKLKLAKNVGLGVNTGVWIRDGNIIFNAKPIGSAFNTENQNIVMHDVTVYELDEKLQVIKVSKAEKAIHNKINWELHNIEVTEFEEMGVNTQLIEKQLWPSRIKPEILSIAHSRPKDLSVKDIIKYRKFQADEANNIPIKYDIALWFKLSYPLLVIATALTGLPFLFGLIRSGGFGQRLLIGVMLGITLYLAKWILQNVGEVFHVHPSLITALPSSIILITVLLYLSIQKKN